MQVPTRWLIILPAAIAALVPAVPYGQTPADLFNTETLQRLELWVNSADWEKLRQNFQENTYYPADVTWNGITVRNTGIRSRGFGSRSGTKPGLRVDFDRYATRQAFLGLKSIVLDNLVQDASAIRETIAMRVYERMGIPAPREAHARLYVNGKYVGLYAIVESIDKTFLGRVFGSIGDDVQDDGYLFDYEYILGEPWRFDYLGSELAAYERRFQPQTHERRSAIEKWGPIETLVRLANDLSPAQYLERLDEYIDLHAFVRFVATQNFIGENDGLIGYDGMNNFYLYRHENQLRHVFIPWDADTAFAGHEFPITLRHEENVLLRKAMEVPELRELYFATLAEAAILADTPPDGAEIGWLEQEVRRQLDLVEGPLSEDPATPYTMDDYANARAAMVIFARERARNVQSQLPR